MTKNDQISRERTFLKRWVLVLSGIIVVLAILNLILLRALCTDVWFIKWLGLPSECTSSQSGLGLDNRYNPSLQLKGNQLTIAGGNTIILPSGTPGQPGEPGVAGINGVSGISGLDGVNGLNGATGATGATGSAGLPGPPGPPGPSDPCSALTTYFCQGGNSFGGTAVFGTNDNNPINTIVNGISQFNTRESGIDINPSAITTFGLAATKLDHTALNNALNWYTIRINDPANNFENGMYLYNDGTFQAGSFDTATGFQGNFFSALPGNAIGYQPGVYMASYDGSTVQTYAWAAPDSFVIGNTRFDFGPTTFAGAQYAADYSANYVPLSLITYQDLTGATSTLCSTDTSNIICQNGNSLGATVTIGTNDANNVAFETAGVTRLTINTSGEIGIGGAPVAGKALAVTGDLKITGVIDPVELQFSGTTLNGGGYRITTLANNPLYLNTNTDRTDAVQVRKADNNTVVLDVDTLNQRVGVNTAAPSEALDVVGNAIVSNNLSIGGAFGTLVDPTRFINLDATIAPGASVTGSYMGINITDNSGVVGNRNVLTNLAAAGKNGFMIGNFNTVSNSGGADAGIMTGSAALVSNDTGEAGELWGATTIVNSNSGGIVGNLISNRNIISNNAGIVGNMFGTLNSLSNSDSVDAAILDYNSLINSGTVITSASLFVGNVANSGTIPELNGIDISNWSNSGTVGIARGIHIDDTISVATSNWALASDSTADSYFTGNLGIGTPTPTNKLDVTTSLAAGYTASVSNTNNTAGANGIQITAGENVWSANSDLITFKRPDGIVTGSVTQDSSTTVNFNTVSDKRLKENIVGTAFTLDTVLAIKVQDYSYKADANKALATGFLAQDLNKIFPGAVTVGSDEVDAQGNLIHPWSIDYGKLTPLLTKGIQDLNDKITTTTLEQNGKIDDINKQLAGQGIQVVSLSDDLKALSQRVDDHDKTLEEYKQKFAEQQQQIDSQNERLKQLEDASTPSAP